MKCQRKVREFQSKVPKDKVFKYLDLSNLLTCHHEKSTGVTNGHTYNQFIIKFFLL